MTPNEFIYNSIKGKKVHVKCDCIITLDIIGVISGYRMSNNEMVVTITQEGTNRCIPVGLSTPKLAITEVR